MRALRRQKEGYSDVITIPFEVNDKRLREQFFTRLLIEALADLDEHAPASWGNMTSQHMVEHLTWAFQCSTGALELPCHTPEKMLDRAKRFLYDNRETPHNFKNPVLGENPPLLQFPGFGEAKAALQKEVVQFLVHFREQPNAIHIHPIFGPLRAEEWQRAHFKHCYHHLLQFGVLDQHGTVTL
jgi:oxepin-CoA hydrolase/3-oxo-5,6-dehydrosuberyl-CoA semialdehyde dehydrogenase